MTTLKTGALAAALLLAAAAAQAADMPYPEAPPPPPPAAPDYGGWYLRGDLGFSSQDVDDLENASYATVNSGTLRHVQKDFDGAPFGGAGVGYQFNQWLRADVTGEYRSGSNFHGMDNFQFNNGVLGPYNGTDTYTAVKSEWTGLVNVYADLGTWQGITPFIGAGIGVSRNTISDFQDIGLNNAPGGGSSIAYADDKSTYSLAWALQAGLAYELQPGLNIEFAYRYLHLGDAKTGDIIAYDGTNTTYNPMKFKDLSSQDFKFGVRWALGTPLLAHPAPQPLMRGY